MANDEFRLLLIEDSPMDADLILHALAGLDAALTSECVASELALRESLARRPPDLVLSDFSMPGFSGQEALRIVRELNPDIPFIFVSGTIGEELAIEALQQGAADYVLKDNLRRLPASIDRALRTTRERSRRQQAEHALRESEERFRTIVETTEDWIWEMDAAGRLTYSNHGVVQLLGRSAEALLGCDMLDLVLAEDRASIGTELAGHAARKSGWRNWLIRWRHHDDSVRVRESSARPLLDETGALTGYRGIDRDVTQRIRQDQKLRQMARIQAVLSALGNAILRASEPRKLLDMVCRLAVEQGEFAAATLVESGPDSGGRHATSHHGDPRLLALVERGIAAGGHGLRVLPTDRHVLIEDAQSPRLDAAVRAVLAGCGVHAQIAVPLGAGPWGRLVLHSCQPQAFDADEIALLERLGADIDHALDFISKSERLEFLAYHNSLTGLPNRTAFRDLLGARLEQAPQVIALVDIANFHNFNDSRGHEFSDELLRAVGRRLLDSFGPEMLLAQLGDERFALALPDPGAIGETVRQMEALFEHSSRQPFSVHGEEIYVDLRCGVLQAPRHGIDAEAVERNALSALAEARNRHQRVTAYCEEFSNRAHKRLRLERELRHAIDTEQFDIFLQPKFNARSNSLTGAEALLRWRHPEHGLVSPADFIPVLEDTGLIVPAGRWVLRSVLAISRRWRECGHAGLRIAVNVSARELRQEGFVADISALLQEQGPDHDLDIEITESLLMDDIDRSIVVLQALRDQGCSVSIDDFGTGYSSLYYLSRLPADVLKIDRSFVAGLAYSPESLALVTNTISLAHSLGLRVVAEGVEEEEQSKLLRLLRCDELQGYLLGRPLPVAEFERKFIL